MTSIHGTVFGGYFGSPTTQRMSVISSFHTRSAELSPNGKNRTDQLRIFFYWNFEAPLWGEQGVTAVLVAIEDWEMVSRG
jgi:hypothetical protein